MSPCPICEFPSLSSLGLLGGHRAWVCRRCRSVTTQGDQPSVELYDEEYYGSWYVRVEADRLRFLSGLLRLLGPGCGRRLLDCGCGAGLAMDVARTEGWLPLGIERSNAGAKMARERGHSVVRARAEAPPVRASCVGAAVILDVLAHVDQPRHVVRDVVAAMSEGAHLVVKTPHRPAWAYRLASLFPERVSRGLLHLPQQKHAISRRGLSAMLMAAGLDEIAVRRSGEAVSRGRQLTGSWKRRLGMAFVMAYELSYGAPSTVATGTRVRLPARL